MRRRGLVATLGGAVLTLPLDRSALPQHRSDPLRVGMATILPRSSHHIVAFAERLAELGYHEGKNLTIVYQPVYGIDGYPAAFRAVAGRGVDIFVAFGNEFAAAAARDVAGRRPVVLAAFTFDPVEKGYAASLARPGGSVTGLFSRQAELAAKRVEFAREAMPQAHGVTLLWDAASRDQAESGSVAARRLGLEPRRVEVGGETPDWSTVAGGASRPGEPVVIPESPVFARDSVAVGRALMERRIASIGPAREHAEAGALLSYGVDLAGALRGLASYVVRIAKGTLPGDLPIEQPTTFELVMNLKTAHVLGLLVPPT